MNKFKPGNIVKIKRGYQDHGTLLEIISDGSPWTRGDGRTVYICRNPKTHEVYITAWFEEALTLLKKDKTKIT